MPAFMNKALYKTIVNRSKARNKFIKLPKDKLTTTSNETTVWTFYEKRKKVLKM